MQIHKEVQAGNIEGVLHQLVEGVSIEERDPSDDRTPLMIAVTSDQASVEMVSLLLERGADVNATTGFDREPVLALAIRRGTLEKVELLLEAGADVTYQTKDGYDVLINTLFSTKEADLDWSRTLFRSPQVQQQKLLPLVEELLARGASAQGEIEGEQSALTIASDHGLFDVVRCLLQAGAEAEQLEWSELMYAIALGSAGEVELLLAKGADLTSCDGCGRTPWLLSLQSGDLSKAHLLLAAGADLNEHFREYGRCGQTPLLTAIENDQMEVVIWLIKQGADVNVKDDFGHTPLMVAAQSGATECVRQLLEAGAAIDLTNARETSLREGLASLLEDIAGIEEANVRIEEMLQSDAPYMDKTDYPGQTAITYATNLDIVRLLVNAGAEISDISEGMRAKMTELDSAEDVHCSRVDYEARKRRRFGTSNPEVMNIPFWKTCVRSRGHHFTIEGINSHEDIFNDLEEGPI